MRTLLFVGHFGRAFQILDRVALRHAVGIEQADLKRADALIEDRDPERQVAGGVGGRVR